MMDWHPYINERLIAEHPSGFTVIKPKDMSTDSQPIFCPLCSRIMKTSYDADAYKKFKCCDRCSNVFVYPNKSRWDDGWRPSDEELAAYQE